jgi:UDP-N-acetylmuramate dehydrogenase
MNTNKIVSDLTAQFPDLKIYHQHSLAPYTTVKIGGPADIFIHSTSSKQLAKILTYLTGADNVFSAHQPLSPSGEGASTAKNIIKPDITILGNGSNTLISDSGLRGIVIKNSSDQFIILESAPTATSNSAKISAHRTENDPAKYLNFSQIDYDESDQPQVLVKIDSGCNLPSTINRLIDNGITGLQWFGFIPGTIGGAVYGNIHGGTHHFSDFIKEVEVFDLNTGQTKNISQDDLSWDYDHSSFQSQPNLIILSVTLSLYRGDTTRAKAAVQAWITQKSTVQSMNSLGSVFQNPPLDICQKIWGEQKSAGWIIDTQLNLKGAQIGDAQISPKHANFIVNHGQATATDYLALINQVQTQLQQKFNFQFDLEIKLLGKFTH